ncbi:MAG: helix-turn-helix domain-containing protein [Candidatus Thorarchaeota archaeon]
MPQRSQADVEKCPVFIASRILGRKWAIVILQELLTPEARDGLRFSEIQRRVEWITPKVLTTRLRQFEDEGIVHREVDASSIPPKVSYSLTEKGQGLRETVLSMQAWGQEFGKNAVVECTGRGFADCHECGTRKDD